MATVKYKYFITDGKLLRRNQTGKRGGKGQKKGFPTRKQRTVITKVLVKVKLLRSRLLSVVYCTTYPHHSAVRSIVPTLPLK